MASANRASMRVRIPKAQFGRYLRTGLWLRNDASDEAVEVKFNPWHDPVTGRFTFKGSGSWGGGGFTGGGGGSFGGGGASGSWGDRSQKRALSNSPPTRGTTNPQGLPTMQGTAIAAQASTSIQRSVERNGYIYQLDSADRTTQVTGTLTLNSDQPRSRSAQATAGGTDRLTTDDGGHYVAVRFNGPTDTFNHFAQDANFNRGGYRVLESEWASDVKQGKTVWVKIVPTYAGSSRRPSTIDILYTVNGALNKRSFSNAAKGKHHGK